MLGGAQTSHSPKLHSMPSSHLCPQAPQLSGSKLTWVSHPFVGLLSQLRYPLSVQLNTH